MTIKIRHVEKLRGSYGLCSFVSQNKIVITIARSKNRRLSTYGATLLHELLHVWIAILESNGLEIDNAVEHDFIGAMEKAFVKLFRKLVGRKK